jgi:hypothetical protein
MDGQAGCSAEDYLILYEGLRESAAFRARWDAFELVHKAASARKDLRQTDVAARLGVTKGRVSQVLAGPGDPSVSTLARYLRVCGYELKLEAVPVTPGVPALE